VRVPPRRPADPRSVDQLDIFRNAERIGVLRRTVHGARFEYDAAFFEAHRHLPGGVATSLPYATRSIETTGVNLPTYFAGLLPEGLRLKVLHQRVKTSEDDLFSLLVAAGSDTIGDLFPVLPGQTPQLDDGGAEIDLAEVSFHELFQQSLETATEPAVPGVQAKLSPSVISFPFATRGKRWILKLDPPDKPGLVRNESFFMEMARACGLDVARTKLVADRIGAPGLLVERFDRRRENRRWVGVHQEDACQLADRYPAEKYRLSINDLAKTFSRFAAAPTVEVMRLVELLAFSFVIGNGDLHAKNISLLGGDGALQLSPAYDLLSTRPYGDRQLALMFDGRNDKLTQKHLLEFGVRFGVATRAIEARVARLAQRARPFIDEVKTLGLDTKRERQLRDLMTSRLDAIGA
jgi:serine/threonine-protein kinase HipA